MSAYSWQRDGLVPAAGALAEALCLYAWLALGPLFLNVLDPIAKLPTPSFSFGWVWLLLAAPVLADRLMDVAAPRSVALRRWTLAVLAFALFALFILSQALPGTRLPDWRTAGDVLFPWAVEPASIAGHIAIYWLTGVVLLGRGLWLAASEPDSGGARGWFSGWLIALFTLCLVSSAGGAPHAAYWGLGSITALYFCVGLTWLTLVRRFELQEDALLPPNPRFNWSWLAVMLTGAAAMLAVAALLTSLEGVVRASGAAIGPAIMLLWPILGAIVVWPAHVMWFDLIQPLLGLLPRDLLLAAASDQPDVTPTPTPTGHAATPMAVPPHLGEWALLIVVLACIVALLRWRVASSREPRPASQPQAQLALWSWRTFFSRLAGFLGTLPPAGNAEHGERPSAPERGMSVRLVYRAVLRWCQERHRPRPAGATPLEFEGELRQMLPPDLAERLTATYVHIRYGGELEDPAAAEQLLDAWQAARDKPRV